jgi:hypothetical protein
MLTHLILKLHLHLDADAIFRSASPTKIIRCAVSRTVMFAVAVTVSTVTL